MPEYKWSARQETYRSAFDEASEDFHKYCDYFIPFLKKDYYDDYVHSPHFQFLMCLPTFMAIRFTELDFKKKDIETVKFCQELINSFDCTNVKLALEILLTLKPK